MIRVSGYQLLNFPPGPFLEELGVQLHVRKELVLHGVVDKGPLGLIDLSTLRTIMKRLLFYQPLEVLLF